MPELAALDMLCPYFVRAETSSEERAALIPPRGNVRASGTSHSCCGARSSTAAVAVAMSLAPKGGGARRSGRANGWQVACQVGWQVARPLAGTLPANVLAKVFGWAKSSGCKSFLEKVFRSTAGDLKSFSRNVLRLEDLMMAKIFWKMI